MSTRAVLARQTSDGWEGVYQHSDGYPTGLGRELWHCLHSPVYAGGVVTYDPSSDGADGLEWAYCFNSGSLTVFAALPADVRRIGDAYQTATGDVYQCRPFAWQVVGVFSLRGDEPDWQVVECCRNYAWAHLSGADQEKVKSDPRLSKLSMREYVRVNGGPN